MTNLQELWSSPPWSFDANSFGIGILFVISIIVCIIAGYLSLTHKNDDEQD